MIMEPEERNRLLQKVGSLILDSTENGWQEIVMDFAACHRLSTYSVAADYPDGSVTDPDLPDELIDSLRGLREGMHRSPAGTWFSLRYAITSENQFHVDYEYDDKPDFGFEIAFSNFLRDLEKFPRDEENIPGWLREKLLRAAAGEN
ncbi:hypothetical protein NE857_29780 [Nocardiopsis exhalans]|uniref:Uncharacterized protein n=1 Tax=Nocardiopsis exhalans TaxID=163604 RepID=A0ABY5D8A4_9ACTN|nr:hypothetical protein [Nocardiopsis exhalans]USY19392.1 hypothetical protein NE857_29780 [Nocardiopsis exhalans]